MPVWNEERRIALVIDDLRQHTSHDVLVVDDGSTDRTCAVAEGKGCVVIRHATNAGVGAAIRTGITYAIQHGYEVIAFVSGSGKTPAAFLSDLVNPILTEGCDFVQGSRYLGGGKATNLPFHRSLGTRLYSAVFSLFLGRTVTDGTSGFRAIRVAMLKDPRFLIDQPWLNRYELEPYLYYKAVEFGYKVREAPVEIVYPAARDYTKMRVFVDWWRIVRPLFLLKLGLRK